MKFNRLVAAGAAIAATLSLAGVATSASGGAGLLWVDFASLGFMATFMTGWGTQLAGGLENVFRVMVPR